MPSFTVLENRFKKNFGEGEKMRAVYILRLDDGMGGQTDAEMIAHPKARELQQGETVEGELKPNPPYPPNFVKAKGQAPAGSNGKGEPYRKHPAEVAAVQRAHAQEMAVRQMGLREELYDSNNSSPAQREARMLALIDWFEADVRKAMAKAEGNQAPEAPQSHVNAPQTPIQGDPAMETREEMEERVRAEVLAANPPLRRMP